MTPQELKQKHPDIYASWFQEGYDRGVALGREEALKLCRQQALDGLRATHGRSSSENIIDAWFASAFPKGFRVSAE